MFSKELGEKLDQYHLLKHPFYQVFWNEGKLTREIIKDYAEQYYQHVKAFPRYISATHSICEDIEKRRILLENLQDEENKDGDHPKLWKNFAKALGADEKEIEKVKLDWFTKDMIDNFSNRYPKAWGIRINGDSDSLERMAKGLSDWFSSSWWDVVKVQVLDTSTGIQTINEPMIEDKDCYNKLMQKIESWFSNPKIVSLKIDKDLIGGLKLQLGSFMIDTSIKNKLNKYKQAMLES